MWPNQEYETVIGLEVHAQLLTKSKLFCADSTVFGMQPNTQTSAISLGHPGTLPRLNQQAVLLAVKLGLACNCQIAGNSYFARKNYFYPDLPKGYQTSQHTAPICQNGFLEIEVAHQTKKIRFHHIHLEEDAGKSLHQQNSPFSDIDYNRAGMPLVEIVTEPDLRSAEEAFAFVTALRKLVRRLNICDGNMEQGSLRCDVNISVRRKGDKQLGTKVEIKNLNSIRFIKKAIETESRRLIEMHRNGERILQQTRGLNENDFTTYPIRTKENEDDYRYFPDPDLPPFFVSAHTIETLRSQLPPTLAQLRQKLVEHYGLAGTDAEQLVANEALMDFFLAVAEKTTNYKAAANWTLGPVKNNWNELADNAPTTLPQGVATIIGLIDEAKINYGIGVQKIWPALLANTALDIEAFVKQHQLAKNTSENQIDLLIDAALAKYQQKITEYKKGKKGLISLFVGEVMKLSQGNADAKLVTEKIVEKLKA